MSGVTVSRELIGKVIELHEKVMWCDSNGFAGMSKGDWEGVCRLVYDIRAAVPDDRQKDRRKGYGYIPSYEGGRWGLRGNHEQDVEVRPPVGYTNRLVQANTETDTESQGATGHEGGEGPAPLPA